MSKLPNIQILRAIAASIVVIYHCAIETTTVCAETKQGCSYDFWPGGYGVALFFVISGFIMVATSWNAFSAPGASLDFLKRRIQRIVPLYWLLTTIAAIGVFFIPSMLKVPVLDIGYVISSYLFWPVMRVNGFVRPIANLGWTLNLEMMFYAVFALGLFFKRPAGLLLTIALLLGLSVLQMVRVFAPGGSLAAVPLNFWGDPIILNFISGMIAAVVYKKGYRITGMMSGVLIAVMFLLVFGIHQFDDTLKLLREDHFISRMGDAAPSLVLFVAAAFGPQIDAGKLTWRAALLVGDASYSLYLIHPFVLRSVTKLWIKLVGEALPAEIFGVVCVFAALAAGLVTYWLFERPMVGYFATHRHKTVAKLA